jgi:hypothetical protein
MLEPRYDPKSPGIVSEPNEMLDLSKLDSWDYSSAYKRAHVSWFRARIVHFFESARKPAKANIDA